MCGGGGGGDGGLAAREAERQAAVNARIAEINSIFDQNTASNIHKQAGDAVFALDKSALDDSRMEAERVSRFDLARRGLAGGSQDVDRNRALLDTYNKGLLQAGQRSSRLVADWQGADEELRNTMIRQVAADPAAFNAQATRSQLLSASESRKNAGVDNTLADLIKGFTDKYNLSRYSSGVQAGMGGGGYAGGGVPLAGSVRGGYQGS